MPNRLSESKSSYLQAHAQNPIDWWPWCQEAFDEAARRNLPVLISIGYAACHWCHVMAEETFTDQAVADFVNENFVAIKVDREEHPDVDAAYMSATQALTGQGGWPNTVFTTATGQPFFAGTYFPPEPTETMPSFLQVVQALADAWATRGEEVVVSARQISAHLNAKPDFDAEAPRLEQLLGNVASEYDLINGGFGNGAKFPCPTALDALMVKGDHRGLDIVQLSCEAMARGGIYDQVGGGFHRYTTDSGWIVPHFEKMLYDNALLLGTYCRAWRRTPNHDENRRALFERVIFGTVDWLVEEMLLPGGGFASSLAATSEDTQGLMFEGIYYLWNPDLLNEALGFEDGTWAGETFHVTHVGTYDEGFSTIQLQSVKDYVRAEQLLAKLKAERANRARPARDEKVVAAWNGLLIDSLVLGAMIFREPKWLELAVNAGEYLWRVHRVGDEFRRVSYAGQAGEAPAACEDYAAAALGFAKLASATGDQKWLDRAKWCLDQAVDKFADGQGGFFDGQESNLYQRCQTFTDNPTPSPTSIMVFALNQVGLLSGEQNYLALATQAAKATWGTLSEYPRQSGWALADYVICDESRVGLGRAQIAVVDEAADPFSLLNCAVWRMAPEGSAIVIGKPGQLGDESFGGLFAGRGTTDGKPTAYICRGNTCFEPVSDYNELKDPLWKRC